MKLTTKVSVVAITAGLEGVLKYFGKLFCLVSLFFNSQAMSGRTMQCEEITQDVL